MVSTKDYRLSLLREFVSDLEGLDTQLGIEPKFRAHIGVFSELRQSGEKWGSIAAALIRLGVEHRHGSKGLAAILKTYWNRNKSAADVSVAVIASTAKTKIVGKPSAKPVVRSASSRKNAIIADRGILAVPSAKEERPNLMASKRSTNRFEEIRRLRKATRTSFEE